MSLLRDLIRAQLFGSGGEGGSADLSSLLLFAADYEDEPPTVTSGAVNKLHGYIVGH